MFFVTEKMEERHDYIRGFLTDNTAAVAIILAAANFEWTFLRALLKLGKSDNDEIMESFSGCRGIEDYKGIWRDEVAQFVGGANNTLVNLVQNKTNWEEFRKAYALRNLIMHGNATFSRRDHATAHVDSLLGAAEALVEFARAQGQNLYQPMETKQKPGFTPMEKPAPKRVTIKLEQEEYDRIMALRKGGECDRCLTHRLLMLGAEREERDGLPGESES